MNAILFSCKISLHFSLQSIMAEISNRMLIIGIMCVLTKNRQKVARDGEKIDVQCPLSISHHEKK